MSCRGKEISDILPCPKKKKQLKGMNDYALVHPREARCIVIWCYSVNLDHISSIYISFLRLDKYGSRHFWEALRSERFLVYLAIVVLNNWGRGSPSRITAKIINDVKRAIEESNEEDIFIFEIWYSSYLVICGRIHRDFLGFNEKEFIAWPTVCCWKIVGGGRWRPQLDYSRIGYNKDGL